MVRRFGLIGLLAVSCVESREVLTRTTNRLSDAGSGREPDASQDEEVPTGTPPSPSERPPHEDRHDAGFEPPAMTEERRDADFETPVLEPSEIVVGTGYHSTCASVFGKLYCWGDNTYGQLSTPPDRALEWPTRVSVGFVAAVLDGGERHMCALDTEGAVHCWGTNDAGQLGQGDRQARYEPTRVELPEPARVLSSGESHVCVIGQSARLYCWGWNKEGQLALGEDARDDEQRDADVLAPQAVGDDAWSTVSAGQGHTCGTQIDGSLWCWGRNYNRQVGQFEGERFRTPQRVGEETDWKFVVAGQTHSCGLHTDHSLWCWGSNLEGEPYPLGEEWPEREDDPQYVSGVEWRSVHTRWMSSCGLTLNGEGLCWGRNEEGQLGLDDFERRDSPAFVGNGGLQISTGLLHTCGVTENLDVYCTGNNESGQLGVGDYERRNQFTRVRF